MASVIRSYRALDTEAEGKKPAPGRRAWYEPWVLVLLALGAAPSVFLGGMAATAVGWARS